MTITEAAHALRARSVSSAELTRAALAEIERLNPRLNAFITVTSGLALERARLADDELARGVDRGPLHGIPYGLKDLYLTRGIRTTAGSPLIDHTPAHDAAVVERLDAAGAVLLGKQNVHELAYGITSNNPHFGAVRNPWDLERIPGGSSGGSGAAVATGMGFFAMGSDTGGSIRIPASYCGVTGLKPTYGRVSRRGTQPLGFSLDHMGPIARTVADAALVLEAVAGHDPADGSSSRRPVEPYVPAPATIESLAGVRIGMPGGFFAQRLQPEVSVSVVTAARRLAQLGATVTTPHLPDIAELNVVARVILLAEATAAMEPHISRREQFGADVLALLDQGRLLPATAYVNAQRLRRIMQQEFNRVWQHVDCLLTATTAITAPPIGAPTVLLEGEPEDVRLASTRLVRCVNLLGLPAVSLPGGVDAEGMPIGLQLIAPALAEARLLRIAAALEAAGEGCGEPGLG